MFIAFISNYYIIENSEVTTTIKNFIIVLTNIDLQCLEMIWSFEVYFHP